MSLFVPIQRATLHIPGTGPAHDRARAHLYVIVTKPCPEKKVMLVPVCSAHERCDKTCVLPAGCHSFIKHDSYADYSKADTALGHVLMQSVKAELVKYMGLLDAPIFDALCAGIEASRHITPRLRKYYRANSPAPR